MRIERTRRNHARWPSTLCACLWLAIVGCGGEAPENVPQAEVERGTLERLVIATGTIEPRVEVEIRPRIAGIVQRIASQEGDRIEPGTVLVEIERELLESRVREARAALREAEVERRFAKIAVDRMLEMNKSGASSDQKRDDAEARFERAKAARARARAALDTLSTQLGYADVRSPLAGRVLEVHIEAGDAVSPVTSVNGGTLLLTLAGNERLHLEGLVDENEVARVEIGQTARIQTEAFADRVFEGVVREIAPLGQRVQNVTYFEVKIEVTDADASLLRPRMSGDAEIVTEVVRDAVFVPETALRYRGEEIYVEVGNGDGSAEQRAIEIGLIDGAKVQILSGLEAGESVRLQ
ncbi:MAG: efflux RND transporter periplasmic adaptor subunit [Myxococcota bacterium]